MPALEALNLKPRSSDKQLTSVMKILSSYLGCGGYLVEKKGLLLAGMSSEAFLQAVEGGEVVESAAASRDVELKFSGG